MSLSGCPELGPFLFGDDACRDVKPENLLVRPREEDGKLHLRLIDFGSAIDGHSLRSLYGPGGASEAEQTAEYAPPEALLGRCAGWLHHSRSATHLRRLCKLNNGNKN